MASLKNFPFGDGYAIENSRLENGLWREIFNSDAESYGGNNVGNLRAAISASNGRIQASQQTDS
ncbi:MAG: hypothetical protein IGR93_19570 [Hydrococcus sp. C42_A2020_068]|nr:hypothetical protein [Hydrococcus sp. C42_A2020_068]